MTIKDGNKRIIAMLENSEFDLYDKPKTKQADASRQFSLGGIIDEVLTATTTSEIHKILVAVREHYSFDFFSYYVYLPRSFPEKPLSYLLDDYSIAWIDHYVEENFFLHDPTISHTLSHVTPILMETAKHYPHLTPGETLVRTRAFDFGMRKLSCFPFHGVQGDHGNVIFVHLNGGNATRLGTAEILKAFPDLYMISSYIYEAIVRILKSDDAAAKTNPLTPREQEVLRWVACGKSSSGIGDVLKISENTVLFHMKRIHEKLGVRTRQHAVAKAMAKNLISL